MRSTGLVSVGQFGGWVVKGTGSEPAWGFSLEGVAMVLLGGGLVLLFCEGRRVFEVEEADCFFCLTNFTGL